MTSPSTSCLSKYVCFDGAPVNGDQFGLLCDVAQFRTPSDWGTVHVTGLDIVPNTAYQAWYDLDGDGLIAAVSLGISSTPIWGDVVGQFNGFEWTAPNGVVNFTDTSAVVAAQNNDPNAPGIPRADLVGGGNYCVPEHFVFVLDVAAVVDAFQGIPYPCPLPGDADGDGVCDSDDVCPGFDDNADGDGDGTPDACDPCPADNPDDTDGDGVCDSSDPCPADNPDDSDGDGVCDSADVCPGGDDNVDTDGDGIPDFCDGIPRRGSTEE